MLDWKTRLLACWYWKHNRMTTIKFIAINPKDSPRVTVFFLDMSCSFVDRYQCFRGTVVHICQTTRTISPEKLVPIYRITWHHIPEGGDIHSRPLWQPQISHWILSLRFLHFYVIVPEEYVLLNSELTNSDVYTHGHCQQKATWQLPKTV